MAVLDAVNASSTVLEVETRRRARAEVLVADVSTVVAVAWCLGPMAWRFGGRDRGALAIGLLLLAAACVAVRIGRRARRVELAGAFAVSAAALGVCAVSPTGWAGAGVAGAYVAAAWTILLVRHWAVDPLRRNITVALVISAAGLCFAQAWLPWWGGENAARPMIGTFYWHNPYAASLLPGALLAIGAALAWRGAQRMLAVLVLVLAATGIVLSTSRASVALLVLGALGGAVVLLRVRPGWQTAVGLGALCIAAFAVMHLLTGPPFFNSSAAPIEATQIRTEGQSLGDNGAHRVRFWIEALAVAREHPMTGGGYGSGRYASRGLVPEDWATSASAHSGYLQPLNDGGLLLGIPFLVAVVLVGLGLLRRMREMWCAGGAADAGLLAPIAALAVLGHSAVDFDWQYPSLMVLASVVVALAAPASQSAVRRRSWPVGGAATLLLVVAAWAARDGIPSFVLHPVT